jgi:hypothetical protein
MIPEGDLRVRPDGQMFRWSYHTTGGAEHVGPGLYKTKAQARAAGNKWLAEQRS